MLDGVVCDARLVRQVSELFGRHKWGLHGTQAKYYSVGVRDVDRVRLRTQQLHLAFLSH